MDIKIPAEKLVNGAQALIPYYPVPTSDQIDDMLARLCKTFDLPFTVESDAKALWRRRVGLIDARARAAA
jgi:hypothetical protein